MKMFSILCFAGALVQVLHFITVLPQAFISIESSFQLARWSALLDSILWFVFPLSCVFAIPVLMHRASHSRMSPSSF